MNIEGEEAEAPLIEEAPVVENPEPAEIVAEDAPEAQPEKPARKPVDPLISEITKLRAQNRDKDLAIEAARKEAADAKALAERLAKGDGGEGSPKPAHAPSQRLDDAEIDRRADYKLFLREVADVRQAGEAAFGHDEFGHAVSNLSAYGADNDEFIRQVIAVDRANAHALLRQIADDAARAIGLVNMNPTQRIAELTRMSDASKAKVNAEAKAAPKTISAAPKPAPAIAAATTKVVDWRSDKASDAEYDRGFQEMLKNRRARR